MTAAPADAPRVSVVIPVYNTVAYLSQCLDSVVGQDLPATDVEVVAVDDGSTDDSGRVLDEYARRYPNVHVVHQPNSGWAGQPRNRGMDMSRGEYVFFMDSDDWLGPEALHRMCDFADEHGSDIVAPRLVRSDGPNSRPDIWHATAVDADLRLVLKSLMTQKLFRRSFLEAHGLRFPEAKVRLEDGIFMSRAYLLAKRVSILADYAYYYKRVRRDSLTHHGMEAESYLASVRTIADTVRRLAPDPDLADDVVLGLYERKALARLCSRRFLAQGRRRRQEWVDAVAAFAEDHVPPALQQRLPAKLRLLSEFARRRDADALAAVALARLSDTPVAVVRSRRRLLLEVNGEADAARDITGLVRRSSKALVVRSQPEGLVRHVTRLGRLVRVGLR